MDEMQNTGNRPVNPRRRKRTKFEIFKESYLPLIIAGIALILILVIIVGSIVRAVQRKQVYTEASIAASEEQARIDAEAQDIIAKTKQMASHYDFEGAMALIDGFSGNPEDYPEMGTLYAQFEYGQSQLVPYEDYNSIPNLSFDMLVVDPGRGFADEEMGDDIEDDYITITEFQNILQQLYNNGYMLVHPQEFVTTGINDFGIEAYIAKPLMLPAGKKPIIITQTNVCYSMDLVDGDGDKVADQGGLGFASRMVIGTDGKVDCEYIDGFGQTAVGAYDLVPILDDFVDAHPDFSYKGAKATLAVSGHEGVFGYRTNSEAENYFGSAVYSQQVESAKAVAKALKESGYNLACYTYGNTAYGTLELAEIQSEMELWTNEVKPIIGSIDTFVFAQESDINEGIIYTGDKYNVLKEKGFVYYIGFCFEPEPWTVVVDEYIRQGRIAVTGDALYSDTEWFEGIFDKTLVIDTAAREGTAE